MTHEEIAEKFKTGNYIIVWKEMRTVLDPDWDKPRKWYVLNDNKLFPGVEYKLIPKDREDILEQYLKGVNYV